MPFLSTIEEMALEEGAKLTNQKHTVLNYSYPKQKYLKILMKDGSLIC